MSSLITILKGVFSGDTLFLVIAFAVFFAFTLFLGRVRMISVILSFYPTVLLYNSFPFINKLLVLSGDKMMVLNKLAIFLIFLIPISLVLMRHITDLSGSVGIMKIVKTAGLALVGCILIMILSNSLISLDALHDFGTKIDALFTGIDRIFYWNIGVLALLALL